VVVDEGATLPVAAESPRAAYVHVPFCRHRCGYCDFAVVAGRDDLVDRYLGAIGQELGRLPAPLDLDTLYVGGGTPSHLGAEGLRRLWGAFAGRLAPVAGAEVTIEANPADVDAALVAAAMACGVSRVSLGAQSLSARTLAALDRDHTPEQVRRAVALLLGAGLAVNIDVMTAAPGQSLADVERDLDDVLALGVHHVSVYCLTWERGTRFLGLLNRGALERAEEDLERRMFEGAIERLEAGGFEHYEVSNFARPGHRCRHNEGYWDCRPWEAFGPGAARFDGRTRTTNHRSPFTWMRRVDAGLDPAADHDRMTAEGAARERIVVGLRRRDGIVRETFRRESGLSFDDLAGDLVRGWVANGWAVDDGARVRLTRSGLLLSDSLWEGVLGDGSGGGGTG
jgi:oxygen-independent coproporphyrinogen-3 oxidase